MSADPTQHSLRDLWLMYQGRKHLLREHAYQQASLVWGLEDLDTEAYIYFGVFHQLSKGVAKLTPETQAKVKQLLEEAKAHNGFIQVPTSEELGLEPPPWAKRKTALPPENTGGPGE